MYARWKIGWCGITSAFGLFLAPLAVAQTGITNEGAYIVLRTASNAPLISVTNRLEFPAVDRPSLTFEFGFATAEPDFLDTFSDSFTVTLQSTNQATAIVLSADRTEVAWAPRTPGGLELSTNGMFISSNAFPNSLAGLPVRFAFTVSLVLPLPLSAGPLDVFLDLFDNLNQFASMAYITGLRLDATGSVGIKARFYRLGSPIRTRIDSIQEDGSSLLLGYHFEPQLVELHSAPDVSGPYTRVTNSVLRALEQVFTVSRPNTNQFIRVLSETSTRIVNVRVSGTLLLVEFEFENAPVQVESALTVQGPYFERPATRPEAARRTLRVAKPGLPLPPP